MRAATVSDVRCASLVVVLVWTSACISVEDRPPAPPATDAAGSDPSAPSDSGPDAADSCLDGQRRCEGSILGSTWVETCVAGSWEISDTCAEQFEVCSGAECVPVEGGGSCYDAFWCFVVCEADDTECVNACWLDTSETGRIRLAKLLQCMQDAPLADSCGPDPVCVTETCNADAVQCWWPETGISVGGLFCGQVLASISSDCGITSITSLLTDSGIDESKLQCLADTVGGARKQVVTEFTKVMTCAITACIFQDKTCGTPIGEISSCKPYVQECQELK